MKQMRNLSIVLMCVAFAALETGCSSVGSRMFSAEQGRRDASKDYGGFYPGMRFTWDVFVHPDRIDNDLENWSIGAKSPLLIAAIVDFPFSFGLDTFLLPFDYFVYAVSPMDERGYFNFSFTSSWEFNALRWISEHVPQTKIVFEVNPNLPRVRGLPEFGNNEMHVSKVHHIIERAQGGTDESRNYSAGSRIDRAARFFTARERGDSRGSRCTLSPPRGGAGRNAKNRAHGRYHDPALDGRRDGSHRDVRPQTLRPL